VVELAASDSGGGDRAVVLLHGQPGSGADLGALAGALTARMRVIVPDRPGYGRTAGEAVGFRENARRLLALLDRLGVRSATLAGHSWGAGVALAAAELAPERADALVLVSPVSPTRGLGPLDRALAHHAVGPPLLRAGFGLVGHSLALWPLRRLAAAVLPGLRYDDVLATAVQWRTAPVWRSFYAEQRALVDELPSLAAALASIDLPATVLTGTRDRIASPAAAAELAGALPRGRLGTVPGVGHLLPQQRPDLVAQEITALGARR
jgi:pimeloyl-ACP methyl ester carboxylesterase